MAATYVESLTFYKSAAFPRVRNGSERLSMNGWAEENVEEEDEKCMRYECGEGEELRHRT